MMNNISVKTKLFILLFVPLLLFAGTAVFLIQLNSSNIKKLTTVLYDTTYTSTALILNADRDMYQALSAYQQLSSQYVSPEDKEKAKTSFGENVVQAKERIEHAHRIVIDQGVSHLTLVAGGESIEATLTNVEQLFQDWAKMAESEYQRQTFSIEKESDIMQRFETARGNINDIGEILEAYAEQETSEITSAQEQTRTITSIVLIVLFITLISFGILLIRKLSRTVALVQTKTQQVAQGELNYTPQSKYDKDELGQILFSVDTMIGKMRELIGSIANNAQQVSSASGELAQSARESTLAATHVAENIQDVTTLVDTQTTIAQEANTTMEEMAVGVQRIAESTNVISSHSMNTTEMAEVGSEKLAKLKEQMELMSAAIGDLGRTVGVLSDKSDKIGDITDKITALANQTGILSLNASIEAARAGEHGKGFAVVAQEIRKLAATSLESAQSIHELIGDTRNEIGHASEYMKATISQNEQGAATLVEVAYGFETIVESIKEVSRQLHDTSAVTEQMSASSEEVSASMEQSAASAKNISDKAQSVSAATEEQLALAENISHATEQLQAIVQALNNSVRYFKL
jgi:methyl-accepting chemotaxis protein